MLNTSVARTTLTFSPAFYERLKRTARTEDKTMSQFVEEKLTTLLAEKEQQQLERIYAGFRRLRGAGQPGITDASSRVDDILYGEQGAWKGHGGK